VPPVRPGIGVKPPYEVIARGWRVWDPDAPKYTYAMVRLGIGRAFHTEFAM